uniref:Uncharacterized protein n=1 Tax=Desertifilum tharense IPPAS B-1220 TaxID=1781255 RepID=A0ACD5H1V9_9CYAN
MNQEMMQAVSHPASRQVFACPQLPLAVYREVEYHLRQVTGVQAGLLPQTSKTFEYRQSQVGGVWIEYPENLSAEARSRVEQILAYYGDRYGAWEPLEPER